MAESIKRMDEILNSLVNWLNEYPRHILTNKQKQRISGILVRLEKSEPIDLDNLETAISNEYERVRKLNLEQTLSTPVPNLKEFSDRFNYYYCEGCDERVLKKYKNRHRKSCEGWKKIHKEIDSQINLPSSEKGTSITTDIPGKDYSKTDNELRDQNSANRKQDGARDYYQIRERGRFGSFPDFEDYGEESTP